eukprot:gene32561-17225_t
MVGICATARRPSLPQALPGPAPGNTSGDLGRFRVQVIPRCHCSAAQAKTLYTNANFPVDAEGRTYHLHTKRGEVAPRILSVGSTGRAMLLANFLDPIEAGKPRFERQVRAAVREASQIQAGRHPDHPATHERQVRAAVREASQIQAGRHPDHPAKHERQVRAAVREASQIQARRHPDHPAMTSGKCERQSEKPVRSRLDATQTTLLRTSGKCERQSEKPVRSRLDATQTTLLSTSGKCEQQSEKPVRSRLDRHPDHPAMTSGKCERQSEKPVRSRLDATQTTLLRTSGKCERQSEKPVRSRLDATQTTLLRTSGNFNNVPISIISTHMGMPNMDFVVRESRAVIDGPMAILRLGTCGVIQPPASLGNLVLATHGSTAIRPLQSWKPGPLPRMAPRQYASSYYGSANGTSPLQVVETRSLPRMAPRQYASSYYGSANGNSPLQSLGNPVLCRRMCPRTSVQPPASLGNPVLATHGATAIRSSMPKKKRLSTPASPARALTSFCVNLKN